eukprot:TRINITY_DN4583_c0_g1_i1.p1 TRINITY_DN4583_c0_g1~~TRINITY_DN4583_c0_g1_i1.p1  ORF type:complete len:274 (-),score=81.08 TRINITY_DN4583_c0_g1_i1:185-1006(-)
MDVVKRDALKTIQDFSGIKVAGSNAAAAATSTSLRPVRPPGEEPKVKEQPKFDSIANYKQQEKKSIHEIIYDIVNKLKQLDGAQATPKMLAVHGDVYDPDIFDSLNVNPKVSIDMSDIHYPKFSYKPKYPIRGEHELLDFINNHPDGLDKADLIDSYKKASMDLETLHHKGLIYKIHNKDKHDDVIYPNELSSNPNYRKLAISDDDLQKEMVRIGMKAEVEKETSDQFKKRPAKEKGRKKGSKKRVRYYNKHVTEIDLTKPHARGLEAQPTAQ